MTAYAKEQVCLEGRDSYLIELISVNRKSLDVSVYCPKELSSLEIVFRQCLASSLSRGSVTLRISREASNASLSTSLPDKDSFKNVYDHLSACCVHCGMDKSLITPSVITSLLATNSSFIEPMGEKEQALLIKGLKESITELIKMGDQEGQNLQKAMVKTLDQIAQEVAQIDIKRVDAPKAYREKLLKRIAQIDHGLENYEERIAREVILFSEKVDIEEEIVRLASHLKQFRSFLESETEVKKGKKLEFLAQEIHREINTIAAKSHDIELISLALEVKGLTKTLVEQLQNIV
ncbi:hypothetical protein COB21_01620 [Candidatus Aerophobetes bacterium]|uniref:YicC family protein n=1 Tax=Aerophobetes bacterium TaxID=2030807 RepID=A0A2A4X6A1_UNCAE|nr:MAG: hypothetical protein COB21_01620 [Candidatus Aerophobetes bacterium]